MRLAPLGWIAVGVSLTLFATSTIPFARAVYDEFCARRAARYALQASTAIPTSTSTGGCILLKAGWQPPSSIVLGDPRSPKGSITWDADGTMKFSGNVDDAAKVFAEAVRLKYQAK